MAWGLPLWAQFGNIATILPPQKVVAKRQGAVSVPLQVQLKNGYHANSDKPLDEYLIPMKLTWEAGPLQPGEVVFPKPKMENYEFSPGKPLSVFTGDFTIETKAKVKGDAATGATTQTAKLRYQACTDKLCLPPKTISVSVPVEVQ